MKRKRIKLAPIRSSNKEKKTFIRTHTQERVEEITRELKAHYKELSAWCKIQADVAKL